MSSTKSKRITILSESEINELYSLPKFTNKEREEYFSLDDDILQEVRRMRKSASALYLILLLGYFRAKPVALSFQFNDVKDDLEYIRDTYFPNRMIPKQDLPKSTKHKLMAKMLSFVGYSRFNRQKHLTQLTKRLEDVATIHADAKYVFDECIAYFSQHRIALTGYTTLQDVISVTLSEERKRIESILAKKMSRLTKERLLEILHTQGLLNSLSAEKGSAKDFTPTDINIEIATHSAIKDIYPELKRLISHLELSQGNMAFYASIVRHKTVTKLRRFSEYQGLLYLSCYLFFRYRETDDQMVTAFKYLIRKHQEAAKAFAKQRFSDDMAVIRDKLKFAGKILQYFIDDETEDTVTFGEIRKKAFSLISKDELKKISLHLNDKDFDMLDYQWQYTDSHSRKIANSMRKLFISIDMECDPEQPVINQQIIMAKQELENQGKIATIDQRVILKKDKPYLCEDKKVNTKRFEFYLYQRIRKMLEDEVIFITESEVNKRLEDDLIPTAHWKNHKEHIIDKTGQERLITPISKTLDILKERFKSRLINVTNNINNNANDFVKHQPKSKQLAWSLAHKRWKDDVDNPIYNQLEHMSIIEIMDYVDKKTGYLSAFKGVSTRKNSIAANRDDLIACVFGNGANYGVHKISSVSDRTIGALRSVNDNYVTPDNTRLANDLISNGIANLPIFKLYGIDDDNLYGSIDGQKLACRINTLKARYSAKYFRKGKGISAMTLVSNHVPIASKVIAPNEYEGHFAFDLLYNNTSDIQPTVLTSDSHGVNNVNFAVLDLFGYQFAPRYAKFKKIFDAEFEVVPGEEMTIELKNKFNFKLIEREWEAIQRIMCSLSRKTTTQHTVIRKLSNKRRYSRTLAALHEYDRLIKCLYLLEYVDNQTLRQFVQTALNRGESYHQLRKAIASVNGNQLRGGTDYQIEQWTDCARVIANCIIYYNSALLSGLIEQFEKRNRPKVVDMIAGLSPIAWAHIQLAGKYSFGHEKVAIDIDRMLSGIDPLSDEVSLAA
jgi:TnpA family transposase